MGRAGKLVEGSSFYFVSHIAVVLAGMISLPIWTRLFTTEQYGLFSLFAVTLAFMVALSKFGMQHAALRFYSDAQAGKLAVSLRHYYSSMFIGGFSLSLVVTTTTAVIAYWLLTSRGHPTLPALVMPVAICVVLQSATNILLSFVLAEQRAKFRAVMNVVSRYGNLALALLMVAAVGVRVTSVYWGYAIFGTGLLGYLVLERVRKGHLSPRSVSPKLIRDGIAFGFPLIWLELSNNILAVGDRYFLQYYIGATAVSMYSVGYNSSQFAIGLLQRPLHMAAIPMYLSTWAKDGEEATQLLLNTVLKGYFGLAIPLALGVSWFGAEIVTLLATEKFLGSVEVIPWVVAGLAIRGTHPFLAAGLRIEKKTLTMMVAAMAAAGLNLLLNYWLVPISGTVGAAQATLISYGVLTLWVTLKSRPCGVNAFVDPLFLLKSGVLALVSVWSVDWALGEASVLWKIPLVVVIYGGAMLVVESDARQAASALLEMVRRRRARGRK